MGKIEQVRTGLNNVNINLEVITLTAFLILVFFSTSFLQYISRGQSNHFLLPLEDKTKRFSGQGAYEPRWQGLANPLSMLFPLLTLPNLKIKTKAKSNIEETEQKKSSSRLIRGSKELTFRNIFKEHNKFSHFCKVDRVRNHEMKQIHCYLWHFELFLNQCVQGLSTIWEDKIFKDYRSTQSLLRGSAVRPCTER